MPHPVVFTDGRYQGWAVTTDSWASWQQGTHTWLLTMHAPPQCLQVDHLRIELTLRVPATDPQADLIATADTLTPARLLPAGVHHEAVTLTLPRVHAAVNDPTRRWRLTATGSQLIGDTFLPDRSEVRVAASAGLPPLPSAALHAREQLQDAIRRQTSRTTWIDTPSEDATFAWLLKQIPRLPQMPPPGHDWAARTTAYLDNLARERIGTYTVTHTNAINGRGRTRTAATLDEAARLAAEQPYNNTRVSVHRVIDFRRGTTTVETVDLAAVAAARPAAAAAFPRPGVAATDAPTTTAMPAAPAPRGPGPRR